MILALGLLTACRETKPPVEEKPPPTNLTVYALQNLRDSGFEAVVLKDFARENNTTLKLVLFPDVAELLAAASDSLKGAPDVILGVDSAFAMSDSLLETFSPIPEIALNEIIFDIPRDPQKRLVPYAYANLSFLYNNRIVSQPPQSFGALQDSRFFSEIALCDPFKSGLGRSQLYWSLALYGESGYEHFWTSLRKNVHKVYPDAGSALEALRKGECGILLGFNSSPAWITDQEPAETHIQFQDPEEGCFQYVESAAISSRGKNRETAVKFVRYLISPETQQFVMYKLGLLPANGRAALPGGWASLPLSVFGVNEKLAYLPLRWNHPLWLAAWEKAIVLRAF